MFICFAYLKPEFYSGFLKNPNNILLAGFSTWSSKPENLSFSVDDCFCSLKCQYFDQLLWRLSHLHQDVIFQRHTHPLKAQQQQSYRIEFQQSIKLKYINEIINCQQVVSVTPGCHLSNEYLLSETISGTVMADWIPVKHKIWSNH